MQGGLVIIEYGQLEMLWQLIRGQTDHRSK